jgi:outer membrane murein-binding lipoprotein Lpp
VEEKNSQITELSAKVAKLTDLTEQLQSEAAGAGADL